MSPLQAQRDKWSIKTRRQLWLRERRKAKSLWKGEYKNGV